MVLYRKEGDDGKWLRYVAGTSNHWKVSSTADKDANNNTAWAYCVEKGLADPSNAATWHVLNHASFHASKWEVQSVKCTLRPPSSVVTLRSLLPVATCTAGLVPPRSGSLTPQQPAFSLINQHGDALRTALVTLLRATNLHVGTTGKRREPNDGETKDEITQDQVTTQSRTLMRAMYGARWLLVTLFEDNTPPASLPKMLVPPPEPTPVESADGSDDLDGWSPGFVVEFDVLGTDGEAGETNTTNTSNIAAVTSPITISQRPVVTVHEIAVLLMSGWVDAARKLVPWWRRRLGAVSRARTARGFLRRFHVATVRMRDSKVLTVEDTDIVRAMCLLALGKHSDHACIQRQIASKVREQLSRGVSRHRAHNVAKRKEDIDREARDITFSPRTRRLAVELHLPEQHVADIGRLQAYENNLVGLQVVKRFVRTMMRDTVGRLQLQEPPSRRHIVLSGNRGSGKRTAARFIAQWRAVVRNATNLTAKPVASKFAVGDVVELVNTKIGDANSGPLKQGERGAIEAVAAATYVVKGFTYKHAALGVPTEEEGAIDMHSLDDLEQHLADFAKSRSPTYYFCVTATTMGPDPAKFNVKLTDLLEAMEAGNKGVVIFGGSADVYGRLASAPFFYKMQPEVIGLPVLGRSELAAISLQHVEERGYQINVDGDVVTASSTACLDFMETIVNQKYDTASIAARNAYLAKDCVDQAVTRKNVRLREREEKAASTDGSDGEHEDNEYDEPWSEDSEEEDGPDLETLEPSCDSCCDTLVCNSVRQCSGTRPKATVCDRCEEDCKDSSDVSYSCEYMTCDFKSENGPGHAFTVCVSCALDEHSDMRGDEKAHRARRRCSNRNVAAALAKQDRASIVGGGEHSGDSSRLPQSSDLPFVLTIRDFDVTQVSTEERDQKQRDVERKIAVTYMLFEGDTDMPVDEFSPLQWFRKQRRVLQGRSRGEAVSAASQTCHPSEVENKGESKSDSKGVLSSSSQNQTHKSESAGVREIVRKPWDFNVIVEGGAGVGKATFAALAAEFMHAYGVTESGSLSTRTAMDLKADQYDSQKEAKEKATAAFSPAREGGGAILITHAEELSPTAGAGQRTGGNSAGAGAAAGEVIVAQTAHCSFAVLSCAPRTSGAALSAHHGLSERFPHRVVICDPTPEEVAAVAKEYSEAERGVAFSHDLEGRLSEDLREHHGGPKGNAVAGGMRFARTITDAAIRRARERLASARSASNKQSRGDSSDEDRGLRHSSANADSVSSSANSEELIASDFEIGKELGDEEMRKAAYHEVDGLVGMEAAKAWLKEVKRQIDMANTLGSTQGLKRCYNLVLTGNPGTGKTTFARLVHLYLKAHGVLTGEFVEKNALELKGEYVGSTAPMVKACFAEAKGGTLFLDEACKYN